jgi:hypothetical protein
MMGLPAFDRRPCDMVGAVSVCLRKHDVGDFLPDRSILLTFGRHCRFATFALQFDKPFRLFTGRRFLPAFRTAQYSIGRAERYCLAYGS